MRLSEAHLSKMFEWRWFFGTVLSKFAGPLMNVDVPLAKSVLAPLANMASVSVINGAFQRHDFGRATIATNRAGV